MTSAGMVLHLAVQGVALEVSDGALTWDAPDGVLRDEDLEQLRLHKAELVSFLHRSRARAEISREAVRLVNGQELPLAERPAWEVPAGASGWPLWILGQGEWVRDCLWPATSPDVEEMGYENRLPSPSVEPWPPIPCPPSEEQWAAHGEQCFTEELDAARRRAGLHLRPTSERNDR
jgi:hypothetical protein